MNVYVYPADFFGCGHYRLAWPAQALFKQEISDLNIQLVPPGSPTGLVAFRDGEGKVTSAWWPPDADVIVLQRPSFPQLAQVVPLIREKGVAVVVDIDDDLMAIHPSNPAWAAMHPKAPTAHSWQAVSDACRHATMVTVSTPTLTRRYGQNRAHVFHNYVPKAFLDFPRVDSRTIAWAGSTHSHPDDLRPIRGALGAVVNEAEDVKFLVVGDGTGAERDLGLPSVEQTGPIEFMGWARAVSQVGVGIAPLADTRFNAAKSWLKPLEYSAVGVPWVASPRVEYSRLHALGCGVLAERPRDWIRELRKLTRDDAYRADSSSRARSVASGLTIEDNVWRLAEAWQTALTWERTKRHRSSSTVLASR